MIRLLMLTATFWAFGCGVSEHESTYNLQSEIHEKDYVFIGCTPSYSECRYSCPTQSGFYAIKDEEKCQYSGSPLAKIACYCKKKNLTQ